MSLPVGLAPSPRSSTSAPARRGAFLKDFRRRNARSLKVPVRDSSPPTQKRIDIPNILVVGLAADVATRIEQRISPFPVVRAADLTEATGLIAAAQPLVVVVTSARGDEEIAILRDLARTVVSEFAVFEELGPLDAACVGMERLLMRAEARRTGDPQRNDR